MARSAKSAPHPDAFVVVVMSLAESSPVTDDRVVTTKAGTAAVTDPTALPRLNLVFRVWQCDKENHCWCEGPPLPIAYKRFDLLAGPSLSRRSQIQSKKI
jgi:hypothetical protein